ncbi:MAG: methionine--tRNA ligase [Gemmataceae bacterium]
MAAKNTWFQTTAIDYPNSRPHIGTAFEKLGADVQARYRRMEGYDVFFLMGNDENTLKVADRAKELGQGTQAYCDDMARQFREVWDGLDIKYDIFVQTSSERHKQCCRRFVQKVYDNGYIYKGEYSGWYCPGCEEFKSEKIHAENAGQCPNHKRPLIRRSEPCYYFKLSAFQDRLLKHLKENPEFVQPETRRNEMIGFIEAEGLQDLNISRHGEEWGIRLPFDPEFTIYVWFDALLTYITGIGYGDDEATFRKYWPCDTHFIGKDITRFHTHIWPAMLWAAGEEAPTKVYSHGFINVEGQKMSKSLGNMLDPFADVTQKYGVSVDAYRYFFLRECPYATDGDYSEARFKEVINSELANNLGNLFSREMTITWKNYEGVFAGTAGKTPEAVVPNLNLAEFVNTVRGHIEGCRYNLALQAIIQDFLTPTNQYLEANAPWKLVKTDKAAARCRESCLTRCSRCGLASILLKPFIPKSAEAIYTAFNFPEAVGRGEVR